MEPLVLLAAAEEAAETSKTPFYVLGGLLAAWAVVVGLAGVRRSDFGASRTAQRGVIAISVLLVVAAVTSSALTG